LLVWLHQI